MEYKGNASYKVWIELAIIITTVNAKAFPIISLFCMILKQMRF